MSFAVCRVFDLNYCLHNTLIRVPEVPFHFLDKLKYEIRNKFLIFPTIVKLRHKTSD